MPVYWKISEGRLTSICNKIRSILGITNTMSAKEMDTNLESAAAKVDEQSSLLDQAIAALEDKCATGGSQISVEGEALVISNVSVDGETIIY